MGLGGTEIIINKNTRCFYCGWLPFLSMCMVLCALDTRTIWKLSDLNSMHQRHSAKWLNYSFVFCVVLFWSIVQSMLRWQSYIENSSGANIFVRWYFYFPIFYGLFDLWSQIELAMVISFLTIVSIMMISKCIKWHSFWNKMIVSREKNARLKKFSHFWNILDLFWKTKKYIKKPNLLFIIRLKLLLDWEGREKMMSLAGHFLNISYISLVERWLNDLNKFESFHVCPMEWIEPNKMAR